MEMNVPRIKCGSQGFEVSKQGLGCRDMSLIFGPPKPESDMIELIHHAVNSGITYLDTSDLYDHANEILIGKLSTFIVSFRELGIGITVYSPLGRGFLAAGPELIQNLPEGDFRKIYPRFKAENLETNKLVYKQITEMAARKGCTPAQLALAWVHSQGNDVCPIPGTSKLNNFNENIGALSVKLAPEEMTGLSGLADIVKGDMHAFMENTWIYASTPPLSSWETQI